MLPSTTLTVTDQKRKRKAKSSRTPVESAGQYCARRAWRLFTRQAVNGGELRSGWVHQGVCVLFGIFGKYLTTTFANHAGMGSPWDPGPSSAVISSLRSRCFTKKGNLWSTSPALLILHWSYDYQTEAQSNPLPLHRFNPMAHIHFPASFWLPSHMLRWRRRNATNVGIRT